LIEENELNMKGKCNIGQDWSQEWVMAFVNKWKSYICVVRRVGKRVTKYVWGEGIRFRNFHVRFSPILI
jgi:hypothetical protein